MWSDYKNNCKKKCAKINRAVSGTGGGPALQLSLTDLENRVMQIIGVQAATGMVVEEAGFQRVSYLLTFKIVFFLLPNNYYFFISGSC